MKSLKRVIALLPVLLAFLFTGCEQLNLDQFLNAQEATDEIMTTANFEDQPCFTFDFPVSISQADVSETFESVSDLDDFLTNLSREDRRSWEFVLPVSLTLEGAEGAISIDNEDDLREIFRDCMNGRRGDCNKGEDEEETGDNT